MESIIAWIKKTSKRRPLVFVLLGLLVLAGCEGTDTREKVDDTVKELSGKKNVERMEQMKKNIDDIKKQQARQADRMKESQ